MHGGSLRSGRIDFDGRSIDGRPTAAIVSAGIRLVPEGRHTFPGMTVEENLLIGSLRGVRGRARRVRLQEMYDLFPILGSRKSQRAVLLSGGEQQMLVIARGLMGGPQLLMLDEPSLGLAPTVIDQVAELIDRIAQSGTTILLAEQNASVALRLARSVMVLRHGTVAFAGATEELRARPDINSIYFGSTASTGDIGSPTSEHTPAVTS
jgi:ABC-type branched-subunit amino acid transport system ATPase component